MWHFPGTREAKTGEFPGVHWPGKLAYLVSSRQGVKKQGRTGERAQRVKCRMGK